MGDRRWMVTKMKNNDGLNSGSYKALINYS